jgi:carbon starvation protein
MFPILFVTVACGAISGFHSLVASGTSSKQINNEKYMLPIGFGTMLVESLLAVLALIAVGALAGADGKLPSGTPPQIFANAIAGFLAKLGLPTNVIFTLITLSVSAFALTSLDSVARVGRLAWQELFTEDGKKSPLFAFLSNKYFATLITLIFGYLLATNGYQNIWPLFGSANQLLAALALIACAVFLKKTKRQGVMLWAPMIIMLVITFSALAIMIQQKFGKLSAGGFVFASDGLQLIFAILLLALGILVAVSGISKLRGKEKA